MRRLYRNTYFQVRPYVPRALRIALRRRLARVSRKAFLSSWPINPNAATPPEGWTGWPDGKKFAFVLTHDVEGARGLNRCLKLAEMELRAGFRSSFNFVPEGEYETPKALRSFLTERGFEVGVHDLRHDGKLYASRSRFKVQAQKINHYLKEWGSDGFRSAFMLHNLDWLRDLNTLYDASTFDSDPFEPQPDGVNTIFPFWVPRGEGSGYVELPYTLPQDSTLFVLLRETGIDIWTKKLDWVASHGGMALVGVHPDFISLNGVPRSREYPSRFYSEFLEYAANEYGREAWFALPKDVAAYVRDMRTCIAPPKVRLLPPERRSSRLTSTSELKGISARANGFSTATWQAERRRLASLISRLARTDSTMAGSTETESPRVGEKRLNRE